MPAYSISLRALRDLRDIREFLSDRSPAAAGRLMTRLTAEPAGNSELQSPDTP